MQPKPGNLNSLKSTNLKCKNTHRAPIDSPVVPECPPLSIWAALPHWFRTLSWMLGIRILPWRPEGGQRGLLHRSSCSSLGSRQKAVKGQENINFRESEGDYRLLRYFLLSFCNYFFGSFPQHLIIYNGKDCSYFLLIWRFSLSNIFIWQWRSSILSNKYILHLHPSCTAAHGEEAVGPLDILPGTLEFGPPRSHPCPQWNATPNW